MPLPETSSSTQPALCLDDIFGGIQAELDVVERIIREKVESRLELVESSSRYIYRSGGKRVRPALLLLAAKACDYRGPHAPTFAAITEFIHTATLVHDDIVDEAAMRRGQKSVNSLLGNDITVLLGDYLYIRSIGLAVDIGNLKILDLICEVTVRMIEGMIQELMRGGAVDLTDKEHLEILKRKTAYLFFGCARMGASLAGAPKEVEEALGDYGMNMGMAFQVADDLLDFTAEEEVLGKPVLSDLKEGHVTLPIIYALQEEPHSATIVEAVLKSRIIDEVSRKEILDLVRRNHSLARARQVAVDYILKAKQCLLQVPSSPYRDSLLLLADYVIDREH